MRCIGYLILLVVIVAAAAWLRTESLSLRAMHTDEAVHAYKLGELLERGDYRYDPEEYHGPTIYALTLPILKLAGVERHADLTETHLRLATALAGLVTVLLILLLRGALGPGATLWALALTAGSPAMVYYSRYYIQEMVLTGAILGVIVCLWRYAQHRRIAWFLAAALWAGVAHATKETALPTLLILLGSAAMAAVWTVGLNACVAKVKSLCPGRVAMLTLGFVAVSLLVAAAFLTNLGQHPEALGDSFATYARYMGRAGGTNPTADWHVHEWHFFLVKLVGQPGAIASEALVVALAVVGMAAGFSPRRLAGSDVRLVRFLTIYAISLLTFYSLIPYKTPWCMLTFLQPLILLAGVGCASLIAMSKAGWKRFATWGVLLACVATLGLQAWRVSFDKPESLDNPYAYAHTSGEVPAFAQRLEAVAKANPTATIHIACPGGDYWPLPWYLRRLPNVGYYPSVEALPVHPAAEILVIPSLWETPLLHRLYTEPPPGARNLYTPLPGPANDPRQFDTHLRADVLLRAYLQHDLTQN